MKKYDAIIIGSGQSGTPLSKRLANAGWKTLIIERQFVGGTCVNYGCTPTKAIVASAKAAYQARRAGEYGVKVDGVFVDLKAVMNRKNEIVAQARDGSEKNLQNTPNLELLYGEAIFTGTKQISVSGADGAETYGAEHIFIDTGGRTAIPDIDGVKDVPYLTSTTILDLEELPQHLIIIGASYIALEFGQMFRRFGSNITLLENSPRFLPKEDKDIAGEMQKILEAEGIALYTNAKVSKLAKAGNGISVTLSADGTEKVLTCSHLLIAAGRVPNTDQLNLKQAGIETDEKGYIKVNDKLETNVPGVYAMGDVKGGPAFTHISYNDYLVVCKNILDNANESITGRIVPYCMFTDPELGRVGITEEEARKKGSNIKVAKLEMKHVARGIETGETKGFMKAVVDADTKKILGVAILGAQGGELMSLLQVAMMGGITYEQLRENIFAHPTFSESINNLFMSLDNQ